MSDIKNKFDDKRKVFDDYDELKRISNIIGTNKVIDIVNENVYKRRESLKSLDVDSIYDDRYFECHEILPVYKVINGFKLHYYCTFAFEYLEKKFDKSRFKVLDVGCGNGDLALALASIGYDVLGIDLSDDSIKKAEHKKSSAKNLSGKINFKVVNLSEVDEYFDFVIFSDVVEHLAISELDVMFIKVATILNIEGSIVIHTPNGRVRHHKLIDDYLVFSFLQKAYQFITSLKKNVNNSQADDRDLLAAYYSQTHINVMTPKQLKNLLIRNGFKNIHWFFRQDRQMLFSRFLSFFGLSTDMGVAARLGGGRRV